jgi:molecular chaperone GrpE
LLFESETYIFVCYENLPSTEGHAFMTEDAKEQDSRLVTLEKQMETERNRSEEYLNRLRYLQADFENLKKRCDRQLEEAKNYANERIVLQLLDVMDELELAVRAGQTNGLETQPLVIGIQMILKKLRKVLEQEGVSPIECEGEVFDPTKHNAITKTEREGVKGCIVGQEIRKGYILKSKVLRPSMVAVEVPPSKPSNSQNEKEEEKKENE